MRRSLAAGVEREAAPQLSHRFCSRPGQMATALPSGSSPHASSRDAMAESGESGGDVSGNDEASGVNDGIGGIAASRLSTDSLPHRNR
ncbi:hypothetical protein SODG_000441 [Sodalis praecaptivus]